MVLAVVLVDVEWILVESGARRSAFLREAVRDLDLARRVAVVEERAEVVGRAPAHRGRFDLVVARGFGPPAVVAECAAPLLLVGGCAVVSEPPGGAPARWPADGLALVGMAPGPSVVLDAGAYQILHQVQPCPERYPRRVGVPGKRPVF
jgi:16S rRNA (guanine527-N7)-methyltransferase